MIMKKEVLSPAGSMASAYAAINNGADAIYLAGKSFGARKSATNFSDEEIIEVINYAHLLNVKVYVTVNTMINDNEFNEAIEFIKFLHVNNVDAVILQDIGLINKVHNMFPNLELHASTQMNNLNNDTFKFLSNLGIKRVVVARELSIDEINKIDSQLEIEAFIHGSLCISYSGVCLFSSMAMNRSGNKGACSQLCRMPYTFKVNNKVLEKEGKYLLSPKDLSTVNNFDLIMNSNITSLKIEGRLKSPEYVGIVTRLYRKLVDAFYNKELVDVNEEITILKKLFNRGYTNGFISNDQNIMNTLRPNHMGIKIGKVIDITKDYITINLSDDLKIKDGIKFSESDLGLTVYNLYKNRIQIDSAKAGDIVSIPNKIKLETKDDVLKTYDDLLMESLKVFNNKKIGIDIIVNANLNKNLEVIFKYNDISIKKEGSIISLAQNKEVTKENIEEKISKLGDSVYKINKLDINKSDNIFIRLSELNELRREAINELNQKRLERKLPYIINGYEENYEYKPNKESLYVFIKNKDQLDLIKKYPIDYIITDNYELYMDNKNDNIYYEILEGDNKYADKVVVNSTSDIYKYNDKEKIINYPLNIANNHTLNYLSNYGLPVLSVELNIDEINNINKKIINKGMLIIYGKPRVMMMKHCLINDIKDCDNCKLKNSDRILTDSFNRNYKVICAKGYNYIYNHKPILKIRDLKLYKEMGVKNFRIDFLDESNYEIEKILGEYYDL